MTSDLSISLSGLSVLVCGGAHGDFVPLDEDRHSVAILLLRVHDVAAAVDVIATIETLAGRRDISPDYVLPDSLRYEPRSD